MSVDLRALAERLGVLKTCDGCGGNGDFDGKACPTCGDRGRRLPTEAEVRSAIWDAGWLYLDILVYRDSVSVEARQSTPLALNSRAVTAWTGDAAPDDLVLLALLRALEACRG